MSTPPTFNAVTGPHAPSNGGPPVADRTAAVFTPDLQVVERSQMTAFTRYCAQSTGQSFPDHAAFHAFSVENFRTFWRLFLAWSGVPCEGSVEPVCEGDDCETARFFPNLRLNYAEVLLGHEAPADGVAITARHVNGGREQLTRGELGAKACRLAAFLVRAGVVPGDRVAVIARNGPEAIIAALAVASIGAVFSSCAPEMGPQAILSRLAQLKPVALIGQLRIEHFDSRVGGDVGERFAEVARGLASVHTLVALDDGLAPVGLAPSLHRLSAILADEGLSQAANWQRFPASHPLFILFSSGTTGAPKCIVHSAGGTLLEHLKEHRLHGDLRAGDKLFFQTSCAWMMWNWQLSALACGVELVLYDGPLEGPDTLWRIVADEQVTVFGTSPAYLQLCEGAGFEPRGVGSLHRLRAVLSTGSILYPRQYDWVQAHVGQLPLQSISGGTDIIGCFLLGNPNLPVHRGDAQCCSLAMDVRALGTADGSAAGLGELICANPFPSRPVGFFGDASGERFHAAYFAQNPGVWTHGDLIEFTPVGGVRLQGRSDGVLNVRGIRVGPAEIYAILQNLDEIDEAMAVEQQGETQLGGGRLILLVVLRPGVELDDALIVKIRSELVTRGSPALLPARIADVPALPKTHNGKASEVAACDVVNGRDARNRAALRNPESLDPIATHPALQPAAVNEPAAAVTGARPVPTELEPLLRGLAQDALGLTAVETTDNLHELGADSLAIVTLTLEIGRRLGCQLPFSALVSAPTIGGLAAYIIDHWAQLTSLAPAVWGGAGAGPQIREATLADAQAIRRLLDEGFNVTPERPIPWERLLEHGWLANKPRTGLMLMDGEELVGFLGLVYAERRINGKDGLTCNLSSWYVKPQYRGWGAALISEAVKDASVSYTAFTPVPLTRGVLSALGFTDATEVKHLFLPLQNVGTLFNAPVPLSFDTAVIERILSPEQRRMFHDHQHCEVLHAVIGDADAHGYLVVKRRRRRIGAKPSPVFLAYTEILFCSNWTLLTADFERVKLALMKRQKTAALMVDDHLIKGPAPRSLVLKGRNLFCSPNFIRSSTFSGDDIDKLYSELVLLPI